MDKASKVTKEALDYLREFGLDPMVMSRYDWDEIGYWEFERDESGKFRILGDERAKRWMEWPEGFNPRYFKRLLKGA